MKPVYLNLTQDALDRAYDQSVWAPTMSATLAAYATRSAEYRAEVPPQVLRYHDDDMGQIDLFPAKGDGAPGPLIFFVHGGAWRSGDRSMYSFLARNLQPAGCAMAIPDFPKIQEVGLIAMVERAADALRHLIAAGHADNGLILSGHSSGAHMAGCLACGAAGEDIARATDATLLVSGMYDMEPVLLSSRRSYVHLTAVEALRLTARAHLDDIAARHNALFFGAGESPEFKRQSRDFAADLEPLGKLASCAEIDSYDHFSVLLESFETESKLASAMIAAVDAVRQPAM